MADDSGEVEFGNNLDDSGAADSRNPKVSGLLGKFGIVRPEIAADDLEAWLQRLRMDADTLDRARCRTLPAGNLCTLKRRASRAGGGEQTVAVAQHDLRVGAYVHKQRHRLALVRGFGEDHRGGIGPNVSGDAGQHITAGVGVQQQIQIRGSRPHLQIRGKCEGRPAQFDGVDAQQQVVHDRVAHEHGLDHILQITAGLRGHFLGELVDCVAHHTGHLHLASRIHHHIGDAAHEVFAKADLRIHDTRRGQHLSGGEVAEVCRNRGGTHIHRKPAERLLEPGKDANDLTQVIHGNGDGPFALTKFLLKRLKDAQLKSQILELPFALQSIAQPPQVAGGVVHVRLPDLHIVQVDCRHDLNVAGVHVLAHDLAVHLAVGGHVNHAIPQELGRAAQAPSVLEVLAALGVAPLHLSEI